MTATSVHPPPRPNPDAVYRQLASDDDWAQRVEVSIAVDDGETDPDHYLEFITRRAGPSAGSPRRGTAPGGARSSTAGWPAMMGLVDAGGGLARYQSVETHPDYAAAAWRARWCTGSRPTASTSWPPTLVMVADPEYSAIRIYRSVGFDGTEAQTELNQAERDATT